MPFRHFERFAILRISMILWSVLMIVLGRLWIMADGFRGFGIFFVIRDWIVSKLCTCSVVSFKMRRIVICVRHFEKKINRQRNVNGANDNRKSLNEYWCFGFLLVPCVIVIDFRRRHRLFFVKFSKLKNYERCIELLHSTINIFTRWVWKYLIFLIT